MKYLQLGDIRIEIEHKPIKNIYLRVYPPAGRVHISAPLRLDLNYIRGYALSKLDWIRKQQAKLRLQVREAPREFHNREIHFYSGKRYHLAVIERAAPPTIELTSSTIVLFVRPGANTEKKQQIINQWYRMQLNMMVPALIAKWEKRLNVRVNEFRIKQMKTRWGTCNRKEKRIWLNLELAQKEPELLEYIVVHEMIHLLERHHNDRFVSYLNEHLPQWRSYKAELNKLPVRHEQWE